MTKEIARLGKSRIWELQRTFYNSTGQGAWSQKSVPFYITTTPLLAHHYVRLIVAFLRDNLKELSLKDPIYLFSVGEGTGRLGFHILTAWQRYQAALPWLKMVKFKYVMVDFAQKNLDAWQKHSKLIPFFQAGLLDCAHFNVEIDTSLRLVKADKTIGPRSLTNPCIGVANYLFNTVSMELLRYDGQGNVYEGLFSTDPKVEEPQSIDDFEIEYLYNQIDSVKDFCPNNPRLQQFLQAYEPQVKDRDLAMLIPIGAMRMMDAVSDFAKGRMLCLIGDKGYCTLNDLPPTVDYSLAKHWSFSYPINFHLLSEYVKFRGGHMFLPEQYQPFFLVAAAVYGMSEHKLPETKLLYREELDPFQAADSYTICKQLELLMPQPSLPLLLAMLKMTRWDPAIFFKFEKHIQTLVENASLEDREKLTDAIRRIWERFYPICNADRVIAYKLEEMLEKLRADNPHLLNDDDWQFDN